MVPITGKVVVVSKTELSIYDPRLMSGYNYPAALVWPLEVTTKDLQPINEFFAILAQTGLKEWLPHHYHSKQL